MNENTKTKTAYWIFTLLFLLPLIGSGLGLAMAVPKAAEGIAHLEYPFYFMRLLGVAKLLGVVAVLTGLSPKLKEWAYAGFAFNMIAAAYSHWCLGDGAKALAPIIILTLEMFSYHYWNRLAAIKIARAIQADLQPVQM